MIKRYLSVVLTAVALTGFGQPLFAAQEKKKGGGGAKHAAAAQVQHAKGKAGGHHFTASNQGSVVRNQARAPQMRTSSSVAQRSVVRDRTRVSQTRTPTVALGGSQFRSTRFETRDNWRDSRDRSEVRYYRPPIDVYRHWDRGRIYTWNDHRYHWYDGAWVILGANLGYDYPGYDYPTTYVHRDVPSGSLAAQVQARLAREGYDPGPIDGIIGPQTRDAIAAFQSDHGLPVTGRIENSLVNALGL
jgi:hypothetical protein